LVPNHSKTGEEYPAMCKVENKYGVDTYVHYRKDGKISVRFDLLPDSEDYKSVFVSNMEAILDAAMKAAKKSTSNGESEIRRISAKSELALS
jgi:hypothetical protein